MPRTLLNKSALARESAKLARYREFLPVLDLKRRQLLTELIQELDQVERLQAEHDRLIEEISKRVPMLADETVDLGGLVTVSSVRRNERNLLGARLPIIDNIEVERTPYSLLAKPHWVDAVARALEAVIVLEIELDVAAERVRRLGEASRIVTQRVNLFERVLIPRTATEIRRLRIQLADAERYATVRGKIAKAKAQRRLLRESVP